MPSTFLEMVQPSSTKHHNNNYAWRIRWEHTLFIVVVALGSMWCFGEMPGSTEIIVPSNNNSGDTGLSPKSIHYQQTAQRNSSRNVVRYSAVDPVTNNPITVSKWAELMAGPDSAKFSKTLSNIIRDSPFRAVYFETKGVTSRNAHEKQFEFVLVDAPRLATFVEQRADPEAFQEHMDSCGKTATACQFTNLGGDATLISPQKLDSNPKEDKVYSHLAAFVRGADDAQVAETWQTAARAYSSMLKSKSRNRPVWFSTSGMGIAWLHFRLDDRPKYYQFSPFANEK